MYRAVKFFIICGRTKNIILCLHTLYKLAQNVKNYRFFLIMGSVHSLSDCDVIGGLIKKKKKKKTM